MNKILHNQAGSKTVDAKIDIKVGDEALKTWLSIKFLRSIDVPDTYK